MATETPAENAATPAVATPATPAEENLDPWAQPLPPEEGEAAAPEAGKPKTEEASG
jgi:hypothetical protein